MGRGCSVVDIPDAVVCTAVIMGGLDVIDVDGA